LLIKLYAQWLVEYSSAETKVKTLISGDVFISASDYIHTLKGVAGNLGLIKLQNICHELNEELKAKHYHPLSMTDFVSILIDTLQTVEQIIVKNDLPTTESVLVNGNNADSELFALLKNNEYISPDLLAEQLQELAMDSQQKEALSIAITKLDYQKALEILRL